MNILTTIRSLNGMVSSKAASKDAIDSAQKTLRVIFSDDYINYLHEFGAISARGVELTGLNVSPRINVVDTTLSARASSSNFPSDMYVVENLAVDGILILQSSEGHIFEWQQSGSCKKIFDDLNGYICEKA